MFWYGNIMLLTIRFFGVAKFTVLTPLSLLSWCRLVFLIVSLKISPILNFALRSNAIYVWYLGKWLKTCFNSS